MVSGALCDVLWIEPRNMELDKQLIYIALLAAVCDLLPVGDTRSVGPVKVSTFSSNVICNNLHT